MKRRGNRPFEALGQWTHIRKSGRGSSVSHQRQSFNYYLIAAAIFATAKDHRGKQLFPRQWDLDYIGLPAVVKREQNRPTIEPPEVETIIGAAKERYGVLYALLAGSGLRIAEALGLEIENHLSENCSIVFVRQQRAKKRSGIERYPKTDASFRDVDLDPALAQLLKNYVGSRQSGFLFATSSGRPLSPRNVMRDSLHPILKGMGRESAGFNIFRRFREHVLQVSEARALLIDYWMGHENGDMAGRYGKQLLANVRWRQECAAKAGIGFALPKGDSAIMDKSGQVFTAEIMEAVSQ